MELGNIPYVALCSHNDVFLSDHRGDVVYRSNSRSSRLGVHAVHLHICHVVSVISVQFFLICIFSYNYSQLSFTR